MTKLQSSVAILLFTVFTASSFAQFETTIDTTDTNGWYDFVDQSNMNPGIPHRANLDCISGLPLILPESVMVNGKLSVHGVGGTENCEIQAHPNLQGDLVWVTDGATFDTWDVNFTNPPTGSAIDVHAGGSVNTWNTGFDGDGDQPLVKLTDATYHLAHSNFSSDCSSGSASWLIEQRGGHGLIDNSVVCPDPGCDNSALDLPNGWAVIQGSHVCSPNCTGTCELDYSVIEDAPQTEGTPRAGNVNTPLGSISHTGQSTKTSKSNTPESACNDFGSGAFTSKGFNIATDGSCALNQATDLPNTDPMVVIDANGIPQPQAGSPVIESGRVAFNNNVLPCTYKDLNGLGRPQDFDLDGVFTCDRGPVEVQGGPNIGAAQTAAYAATGRGGEGSFVEVLANGLAIISFYTYSPDGTTLAWYMGLGKVVGNSIVIDQMDRVTGGVFGAGFDQANIVRTNVGGMSLVFPDCTATDNPGRLNFTAEPGPGLEHLLNSANRLTFVVNCDGTKAANAHRSGAFFALGRSGEGIFVQWLSDGRVALVFYTFDAAGNPFWTTSDIGNTVVNGNTVTANMLYAMNKTKFGANFDPAEVTMAPWGTITLTYTDDDSINFAHNSVVAGFTPGNHAYVRITQPLGTKAVAQGN